MKMGMEERTAGLPRFPVSYWLASCERPSFAKLDRNLRVDAAVIGGGITGITTAYLLAKEGKRVALLEAGRLLNGTTGNTTAKVTAQHDLIYDELIGSIGQDAAHLYYSANMEGLQFIRQNVWSLQIDCDFANEDAYLYADAEDGVRAVQQEFEAYVKLGIPGRLEDGVGLPVSSRSAVVMEEQARFHPVAYLVSLLNAFVEMGGVVFENTMVETVEEGEPTVVLTKDGPRVTCLDAVSCSHFPVFETGLYFARLHAESSYAIVGRSSAEWPNGMYLSVDGAKRSVRTITKNGEKLLLIGGESHGTGHGTNTSEHYEALAAFARERFGMTEILNRWSAHDLVTPDKLPYIGRATKKYPNSYVATGFRKWGMTTGTLAAMLIRDLILGIDNPYEQLFDPSRSIAKTGGLKGLVAHNADVGVRFVQGKLPWLMRKPEELAPDEGGLIRHGGKKAAAYRDPEGRLHVMDATCTHMGCEVEWNQGDRTWDCPCHGSRFDCLGKVKAGPAVEPLKIISE